MAQKPKAGVILCIHFMILLYLVSCGSLSDSIRISVPKGQVNIPPPDQRILLKVGVYLSQAFKTTQSPYVIRGRKFGDTYVGEVLSDGTEKMVRNLFQEVTFLDQIGRPLDSDQVKYDVIVTPQVEQFEYRFVASAVGGHFATQNAIRWRIVSPEGKELYQNIIRSDEIRIKGKDGKHPEVFILQTLNDQFQKAQEDIYVSGWWKKQWWKESN